MLRLFSIKSRADAVISERLEIVVIKDSRFTVGYAGRSGVVNWKWRDDFLPRSVLRPRFVVSLHFSYFFFCVYFMAGALFFRVPRRLSAFAFSDIVCSFINRK